jgi:hypothetical protein
MEFRKLTVDDKKLFQSYIDKNDLGWEYNFATVFLWDVNDTMMMAAEDGILFIYNTFYNSIVFMPPYMKNDSDFLKAVGKISEYAREKKIVYRLRGLRPEQAALLDETKFLTASSRNDYDYIYNSDDLKYLRGKAFHSKRNFVTRFENSYNYTVSDYTPEDYDGLMALYEIWKDESSHSTLEVEKKAVERAFKYHKQLDLRIAVIKVDGKYAGFSVSSIECNGIVHTIFEKGLTEYVGIYQAINKFAAQRYFPDGTFVNRQEDMGIEGLRRAKLSYNPVILYEKHFAEERAVDIE